MATKELIMNVSEQHLTTNSPASYHLIANSTDYVSLDVIFDSIEDASTVDFYFNRHLHVDTTVTSISGVYHATLGTSDFPHEVLRTPGFSISLIYPNDGNEITTNYVFFPVYEDGIAPEGLDYDDDSYIDARIAKEAAEEALEEIDDLKTTLDSEIDRIDENIDDIESSLTSMSSDLGELQEDVTTISSSVDDIFDYIDSRQPKWSIKRDIYINATDGDDANSGTSTSPIQTVNQAIKIMNSGKYAYVNFIFMTDDIYEVPEDLTTAVGTVVHLLTDVHSAKYQEDAARGIYHMPTIKYTTPTTISDGPKIYATYVHIEGVQAEGKSYPIKIQSAKNYLYFENCRILAKNVEFDCPIGVYGGSCTFENCTFTESSQMDKNSLKITDCAGEFVGYINFKGITGTKNPIYLQNDLLRLQGNLFCNLLPSRQKDFSKAFIDAEGGCNLFITERMIPKYGTVSAPYTITSDGVIDGGAEASYNSKTFDYILYSNFNEIHSTRTFAKNINNEVRGPNYPQVSTQHYLTNKGYFSRSNFSADNTQLYTDPPIFERDHFIAYGFITNGGNDLTLSFPLSSVYSHRLHFPRITTTVKGKSGGSTSDLLPTVKAVPRIVTTTTQVNTTNGTETVIKSVSTDAYWSNMLTSQLKLALTTLSTTAITSDIDAVIKNKYRAASGGESSTYNPYIYFAQDQIIFRISVSQSNFFSDINGTPVTVYFDKTIIDFENGAYLKNDTNLYEAENTESTVVTEIPAGTVFSVDYYQSSAYRHGTTTINGTTYTGFIPVGNLPS